MAILLSSSNRVAVTNPTGRYGGAMIEGMWQAGTNIVAGVSPGRGGTLLQGMPMFDTMAEAVAETGCDTAAVYVPAAGVGDAIIENADAGIGLQMVAAEYVPVLDSIVAIRHANSKNSWVIGPNCLGLLNPGVGMLGGVAPDFARPGTTGVISRSGTLLLSVVRLLSAAGIGQSSIVSIGGDSVIGRPMADYVMEMERDPKTTSIVILGEVGGRQEYDVAELLPTLSKPVFSLIVGRHAPAGTQLGHAGALISERAETAQAKRETLTAVGAHVADSLQDLVQRLSARYS